MVAEFQPTAKPKIDRIRQRQIDKLVAENLGLARKQAHKYAPASKESYEDIEGAAFVGLTKAAQRFDPSKGLKFSSLAVPWIRGEILHYLRDKGGDAKVPNTWRDLYVKVWKLPDHEAAAQIGKTIAEWLEIKQACSAVTVELHHNWDGEHGAPVEDDPLTELEQMRSRLNGWLQGLGEGDSQIITTIYMEGNSRGKHKNRLNALLGEAKAALRQPRA